LKGSLNLLNCEDEIFETRFVFAELLCTLRIIPNIGFGEFEVYFVEFFEVVIVVKDTPEALLFVQLSLRFG
jgi:hypothetical protein